MNHVSSQAWVDTFAISGLSAPHLVCQRLVELVDQPVEGAAIDGFGKSIPGVNCVFHSKGTEHLQEMNTDESQPTPADVRRA